MTPECSNCKRWKEHENIPGFGKCQFIGATSAEYWCDRYKASELAKEHTMSGGRYDYAFGRIQDLADAIYGDVERHSKPCDDGYFDAEPPYPQAVLDAMTRCAKTLEAASEAARDVEWFMSGDYGGETLLEAAEEWKIPELRKESDECKT
jgi:hypothetical protein